VKHGQSSGVPPEAGQRAGRCPGRVAGLAAALVAALMAIDTQGSAWAAGPRLQLEHQASATLPNDEMQVTLAAERDGPQVGPLNDAVIAQLNVAIAEARKIEGVRARLGSVWTQPVYSREGKSTGWRVRGEVVLESQQIRALTQLGGRLSERMQMAGVQFRLSTPTRLAEEQRLLREAARGFRDKAASASEAFGFAGYEIRELTLQPTRMPGPRPVMMRQAVADGAPIPAPPPPLPEESGDSAVTVSVSGVVELTR
jgi:predicted secreted protein